MNCCMKTADYHLGVGWGGQGLYLQCINHRLQSDSWVELNLSAPPGAGWWKGRQAAKWAAVYNPACSIQLQPPTWRKALFSSFSFEIFLLSLLLLVISFEHQQVTAWLILSFFFIYRLPDQHLSNRPVSLLDFFVLLFSRVAASHGPSLHHAACLTSEFKTDLAAPWGLPYPPGFMIEMSYSAAGSPPLGCSVWRRSCSQS